MHAQAYDWVADFARGRYFDTVVEFGSRNINGSVRELFDCNSYVGIDLYPGPDVDLVGDAITYRGKKAECIVCCEVLEHCPDVKGLIASVAANLLPGGWFVMTCASTGREPHSTHDGGIVRPGEHYENVQMLQFKKLCERNGMSIKTMLTDREAGDLRAIAQRD